MSIFSVTGLSSGIDFASMTSKLIAFERRPIDLMENKQKENQKQLITWNTIRDKISELGTVADSMKSLSDLSPITGSFTNNNSSDSRNVLSVLSTGIATEQSFDVTVTQLAKNHRIMSAGVASDGLIQKGTVSLTYNGTTTDFTVTDGGANDTLSELKNSINAADIGVTASVINDGSSSKPYHLVLTADAGGASNKITMSHAMDSYNVLGAPVWPNLNLGNDNFTTLQAAQDAIINFGGQTITRDSNTITDLIDETTIEIHSAGSGAVSFEQSNTTLKDKIKSFVAKYNEIKLLIEKNTAFDFNNYDAQSKERGALFGDSTLLGILSTFTGFTSSEVTGLTGNYTSLAAIGITTDKTDGTLSIDATKLDEAIAADHQAVSRIFVADSSTSTSLISFVDHTKDTSSGTYTVFLTGTDGSGNVQGYFKDSSGNKTTATGSGRFLLGADGSGAGLTIRIDESATTSSSTGVGTVTVSLGVAEKFSTEIYQLNTFDGRFSDKTTTLKDNIDDNANKIKFKLDLLKRKEEEYKRRFANLESTLGAMQGQSEFLGNQINGLLKSYK